MPKRVPVLQPEAAVDLESVVKVLVVGEAGVGKTTLLRQYCTGEFRPAYRPTRGLAYMEAEVPNGELTTRLMLWDTGGDIDNAALAPGYFNGAGAAVLVASSDDQASLAAIPRWCELVLTHCGGVPMALAITKCDLPQEEAAVTLGEAAKVGAGLEVHTFAVSGADGSGLRGLFACITASALDSLPAQYTAFAPHSAVLSTLGTHASPARPPPSGTPTKRGLPQEYFDATAPPKSAWEGRRRSGRPKGRELAGVPTVVEEADPPAPPAASGAGSPALPPPPPPSLPQEDVEETPLEILPAGLKAMKRAMKRAKKAKKAKKASRRARKAADVVLGATGEEAPVSGGAAAAAVEPTPEEEEGDGVDSDGAGVGEEGVVLHPSQVDTGGKGGKKKKKCVIM